MRIYRLRDSKSSTKFALWIWYEIYDSTISISIYIEFDSPTTVITIFVEAKNIFGLDFFGAYNALFVIKQNRRRDRQLLFENRFQERGDERCKICIVVIKTVAALDTRSQADELYLHEGCVFCFLNPTISDQFRSEWAWDLNVS